jgi:hypothetical protein
MPEPIKKSLDKLVGTWEITTQIDGRKVTERVELGWVNDESVLVYQGEGENFRSGLKVRFSGILGWDPVGQTVEESGFDTSGGTFKANHKISGEKWIGQMTGTGVVDGAPKVETATREFTFDGKDHWVIVCSDRKLDGVKQEERKLDIRRVESGKDSSQPAGCPWEWMVGDWEVERSDGTSSKVTWRLPDGATDYVLGTWHDSDGTVLHEIVGWEADRRNLVAHAYGTNGAYFAIRFQDVQKHQMSGFLRARNAKGESRMGLIELERVSDGKSISKFISSDGTVVTGVLRKVEK